MRIDIPIHTRIKSLHDLNTIHFKSYRYILYTQNVNIIIRQVVYCRNKNTLFSKYIYIGVLKSNLLQGSSLHPDILPLEHRYILARLRMQSVQVHFDFSFLTDKTQTFIKY